MANSISIIVPTIGRKTLLNTLASFAPDLQPQDHVFVACDGRVAYEKSIALVGWFRWSYEGQWHCRWGQPTGGWGHPLRNLILGHVTTDYVWTIDDDDIAAPGALEAFRVAEAPWTIYRMTFGEGHPAKGMTCWREKYVQHGDIGTPMILAKPSSARFGEGYSGDFEYAQSLQAKFGDPEWDERVVAIIRPEVEDASS